MRLHKNLGEILLDDGGGPTPAAGEDEAALEDVLARVSRGELGPVAAARLIRRAQEREMEEARRQADAQVEEVKRQAAAQARKAEDLIKNLKRRGVGTSGRGADMGDA